jgi:hypothetical protein
MLANQTEAAIAVTQTQHALYSQIGQAILHVVLWAQRGKIREE